MNDLFIKETETKVTKYRNIWRLCAACVGWKWVIIECYLNDFKKK